MKKSVSLFIILTLVLTWLPLGYDSLAVDLKPEKIQKTGNSEFVLTVDKEIIPVGEETEVTLTVTDGENPVKGVEVKLVIWDNGSFHSYDRDRELGTTDDNGQIKFIINEDESTHIGFVVNRSVFANIIIVKSEDEAVLEIGGTDSLEEVIYTYGGKVINVKNEQDKQSYAWVLGSNKTRLITKPGTYTLTFLSNNYSRTDEYYYMVKEVDLLPGEIKSIHFDGRDTTNNKINFKYKNTPIDLDWLKIGHGDTEPVRIRSMGSDINLRVTPGKYNIDLKSNNDLGLFYLNESNIDLTKEGTIDLNWDDSNSGSLTLEYNRRNDFYYYFHLSHDIYYNHYKEIPETNKVILSEGEYLIPGIECNYVEDHPEMPYLVWYVYTKYKEDIINITAGENTNFKMDLSFDRNEIEILDVIEKGKDIRFKYYTYTKGGYLINDEIYTPIKGTLTDPNGKISEININSDNDNSFYIPEDSPSGTYSLTIERDLRKMYGVVSETIKFVLREKSEDVNKDGTIDKKDLELLKQYYGTDESDYDLNEDGVVDILDLVIISKKIIK